MLQRLPAEILLEVVVHIERRRVDKLNLARCCKALYALLRPRLFSHISLAMTDGSRARGGRGDRRQQPPLATFTQAVLCDPYLAGLVQSLRIYPRPDRDRVTRVYEPLCVPSYENAVRSFSRSEAASLRWMDDLKNEGEDAWLALLIVLLHSLQSLDLFILKQPERCRHLSRVLLDLAWQRAPRPYLTSLRAVRLRPCPRHQANLESLPLWRLPLVLNIPSVQQVTAVKLRADATDFYRNSAISSLHLIDVRPPLPQLPALIRRCPRLEEFHYSASLTEQMRRSIPDNPDLFNPTPLYEALCERKGTLRTLSLTLVDDVACDLWQTSEVPTRRYLGDVSAFPVLENLQIRLANLLRFEDGTWEPLIELLGALPTSLQCLCIVDCHTEALANLFPSFEQLADRHDRHRLHNLRKIVLRPAALEGTPENGRAWPRWFIPDQDILPAIHALHASLLPSLHSLRDRFHEIGVEFCVLGRREPVCFP